MQISDLKNALTRKARGTNLDDVRDVNGLIEEAARTVLTDTDPAETKRISEITNTVYDQVYDYPLPSDVKGNKVIDLRPVVNRTVRDQYSNQYDKDFDAYKADGTFNIRFNNGSKSLRIVTTAGLSNADIDDVSEITGWTAGNDAGNISLDEKWYISGGASLKFDLDGATTDGYLEKTVDSIDLSGFDNAGSIFLWLYIPDSTIMTSVDLRWGNDSSNYWSKTTTVNAAGNGWENGWNLIRFDWDSATETGSVTNTVIDYVRVTLNYDGTADTDFRLDNIVARLGSIYEIEYYSKYLFRTTGGTWGETITADTDLINLDVDSYNLLIAKGYELIAEQLGGEDSVFDVQEARNAYQGALNKYNQNYKSEKLKSQSTYYRYRSTRNNYR